MTLVSSLKKIKGDTVSQSKYAKIIGSVMFMMNHTRPDIVCVVSRFSRYTHNLDKDHYIALSCLLMYLKSTMDHCLHFNNFCAVRRILWWKLGNKQRWGKLN